MAEHDDRDDRKRDERASSGNRDGSEPRRDAPRQRPASAKSGPSSDSNRKPYVKRDGDRPSYPKREGERKPYPKRDGDRPSYPKRDGDRPSYPKREGERGSPIRSVMVTVRVIPKRDGDESELIRGVTVSASLS